MSGASKLFVFSLVALGGFLIFAGANEFIGTVQEATPEAKYSRNVIYA